MSYHQSHDQYNLSKSVEWINDHRYIVTPFVWFISSLVALFGIYEVLAFFNIKVLDEISNPFTLFISFSIIIMLLRVIVHLLNNFPKVATSTSTEVICENDSLIEMMKDAESHSRWAEIIKIGSAMSDVLWFSGRKKIRVTIGHFLEVAATQTNDKYTLSSTLIEDLGNTSVGLGKVDEGIKYIERGITIAEESNYPILITRGYRNLAKCYTYKNEPANASNYLAISEKVADSITDEVKKIEALASIEYTRSKILTKTSRYADAINALDKTISHYEKLSKIYPETTKRNTDNIVKVYKEKAINYLSMNNEVATDSAYDSLLIGLRLAQETLNYNNIIRCCNLMAKIQIDRQAIAAAEGMINIATQCIEKTDTPSIINEYNETVKKLEFEKYSS